MAYEELDECPQGVEDRPYLGIEHLTLGRQPVTLLNQRVDLLTALQDALNLIVDQR